ncbi:12859_t:CDS:2 [Cetraspora pellucida]|uniref:12859_t:CDS:1 n=1 Tax=Cetraspora pellucida TaxID=1433469 RepID=A0ACA9KWS0_9GLOM|nr:12859_t:CDS:2 [Cetraspora pellucida]
MTPKIDDAKKTTTREKETTLYKRKKLPKPEEERSQQFVAVATMSFQFSQVLHPVGTYKRHDRHVPSEIRYSYGDNKVDS